MNYPLISEYIEAIKLAEDNFEELTNLRPVLGEDGLPVMTGGNFAVVFKMKDERDGKLYAVKCFTKEQEGREEAYKLIAEELEGVDSPYIVPIRYLEKELFVDSKQTDETEFPVLLMNWVEGVPLDSYIQKISEDSFSVSYILYKLQDLGHWLLSQYFAHGDLKPDNILVKEDGTLVLVDYDGMYVPAMKGQKARELGSPDFRHPKRTEDDFDEHIDDFSIISLIINLLYVFYKETNTIPYLNYHDYCNLSNSIRLRNSYPSPHPTLNKCINVLLDSLYNKVISINLLLLTNIFTEIKKCYYSICNSISKDSIDIIYGRNKYEDNKINSYNECLRNSYPIICDEIRKEATPWLAIDDYPSIEKNNCMLYALDYIVETYVYKECDEYDEICLEYQLIPQGIIAIGKEAFCNCRNVECIILPESLKYIGDYAFWGCQNLCYIVLPKSIEMFGEKVFPLPSLNHKEEELLEPRLQRKVSPACLVIIVPDGYKEYYQKLLPDYSEYIKNISIVVNSTSTDSSPLLLDLAKVVKVRNDKLFQHNGQEENFTIPYGTTIICDKAFQGNKHLRKVTIPDTIELYGICIFDKCENLETIEFPPNIKQIPNGFLSECKKIKKIKLPESITSIGSKAFSHCTSLEVIQIPAYVEKLGDYCFACCEELEEIQLPSSITSLGHSCFAYCKKLKKIYIPPSVTELGDYCFAHCEELEEIQLPSSITSLGRSCFEYCNSLKSIIIPNNVGIIGEDIFQSCIGLEHVTISNKVIQIPSHAFNGCRALRDINLPDNLIHIDCMAFGKCSSLRKITLPSQLESIGWGAFSESGLEELYLPSSVKSVGYSAFKECNSLKNVDILLNTSLKKLDKFTFEGCSSLEKIIIPEAISDIGEWTFAKCTSLKKILLPSTIKRIGNGLFSNCDNLQTINDLDNIEEIGQEAFFCCRNLKHFKIP